MKRKESLLSAKNAEGETGLEPLSGREGSVENANEAPKPPNVFSEALQAELASLGPDDGARLKRHPRRVVREQQNRRIPSFMRRYLREPMLLLRDTCDYMFESGFAQILIEAYSLASRKDPFTREELEKWFAAHRGERGREVYKPIELSLFFSTYDRARRMRRSPRGANGSRGNRRPGKVK